MLLDLFSSEWSCVIGYCVVRCVEGVSVLKLHIGCVAEARRLR